MTAIAYSLVFGLIIGASLMALLLCSLFGRWFKIAIETIREADKKARFWHGQYMNLNQSRRTQGTELPPPDDEPDRSDPDWWRKRC
jgi:hypothetical protein